MDKILYESFLNYFTTLSIFGYKNYQSIEQLLVFLFIQEVLLSDCLCDFPEDELRQYQKINEMLMGSNCLIPIK